MESLKLSSPPSKIKPILIQKYASGRNRNEKHLQKYSISSSQTFRIQDLSQLNQQLPKTLASQHKLSKLEYEFKPNFFPESDPFPTPIKNFFSQIKNLQSTTAFSLHVSQSFRFSVQSCLQPLMMSLASLKNLSSLSIKFCSSIRDLELLKMLFKYLKRIKTLANISISFKILNTLSIPHLDILSSGLSKLLQLRSLELSFDEPFELHGYMINRLTLTLPKLHFLTKICFHFNEESIPSDAVLKLFSCFKNIKTLSDLALSLQSQSANNSKEPISQGLSLLDPLRIRKLNLQSYQHFDNNCLIQFSEALIKFTSLHTFQFSLTSYQPSQEEAATALISALSGLTSLCSLTILLNSPNCNKIVKGISIPFKHLKILVHLDLQILGHTASATNEDIRQLFLNLRFLKSLRFLTLAYPQKGIDDENLKTLAESLKEIPLLQNLLLDFSCASLVTNQGVEVLTSSIKTLRSLSGLKIWLRRNDNVDNETIDQIVEILQGLPCLYSVDLNFLLCSKITCFDELLKALIETKSIGEVALSLPSSVVKSREITQLMETKVVQRMTSF